jgi:hypothetical protein
MADSFNTITLYGPPTRTQGPNGMLQVTGKFITSATASVYCSKIEKYFRRTANITFNAAVIAGSQAFGIEYVRGGTNGSGIAYTYAVASDKDSALSQFLVTSCGQISGTFTAFGF